MYTCQYVCMHGCVSRLRLHHRRRRHGDHHHGHGIVLSIPSIIHHRLHWFLSASIHRRGFWR
uniref:Uncharacterized protein n=1 Tax=Arundo donax TaxID=35708 RepID=A0A0A9FHH5_ARUDO